MKLDLLLTKIVATLGPATRSADTVRALIESGVRVFRVNFSHGTLAEHEGAVRTVRAASEKAGVIVAILGDLCGPKIRVGQVTPGLTLVAGGTVEFQRQATTATPGGTPDAPVVFSCTYPGLVDEVRPGQRLLIDDGLIELECTDKVGRGAEARLVCRVVYGGPVSSHKGVNLPDTDLTLPAITEADQRSIEFSVKQDLDFLALSFVRSASDVRELNTRLAHLTAADRQASSSNVLLVISKIEKPQAVANIEEIIGESSAIMVARGDLGVEMDLAEVPVIQRQIVDRCREQGKPVIIATQMLQSMIDSPTATRAEVSDVANAIFQRADAVMLSGETSVGRYPIQAARTMRSVARHANQFLTTQPVSNRLPAKLQADRRDVAALASGINTMVRVTDARLVVVWTHSDYSVRFLSWSRFSRPIVACSSNCDALRQACLLYGVTPLWMEPPLTVEEFIRTADRLLQEKGWAGNGDRVVCLFGEPIDQASQANTIHVHFVGRADWETE